MNTTHTSAMASQDTLETAVSWYRTGVKTVETNSFTIGLSYLENTIPVFEDAGDKHLAAQARRYRLLALTIAARQA